MINKKLIFDLGFHNGDDSDFYLQKGFNVVAIEANTVLVKAGTRRFANYIKEGRLKLINRVITDTKGIVKFYINPTRSDWSSCDKRLAEIDNSKSITISVKTISIGDLCRKFGTPLYAKIDIEGQDVTAARQIYDLMEKPQYVSFETSKQTYMGIFSWLYISGYSSFQLVNQLKNPGRKDEKSNTSGEGKRLTDYRFSEFSSGFFGRDLPPDKWLAYDEALSRYLKYKELKILDNQELALGWLDLHAKL